MMYSSQEFAQRLDVGQNFLSRVMEQTKIDLLNEQID